MMSNNQIGGQNIFYISNNDVISWYNWYPLIVFIPTDDLIGLNEHV